MHVLVINSGSSSIKFSMFEAKQGLMPAEIAMNTGEISGIGNPSSNFKFADAEGRPLGSEVQVKAETVQEAIRTVGEAVTLPGLRKIDAVGYRVVHPGPQLQGHHRITPEVLDALREASGFAPLHNPEALAIIEEMMRRLPDVSHFACFDTVFHETMPEVAKTYAIPREYLERGVRRYGFHGLSCESIIAQMRERKMTIPKRMVIAHLGSGCSLTALVDGASVDTTMGLTPTGGIVMGTRPGDLDPGLLIYLLRQQKGDQAKELETMLNHHSGMAALSGLPNDMKALRKAVATDSDANHDAAKLAVDIFVRGVRKAIGSFAFLMGGLDAIVFTGGIGEHDAATRREVTTGLESLGITLDEDANVAKESGFRDISARKAPVNVFVVPAEEDRMIAWHVGEMSL